MMFSPYSFDGAVMILVVAFSLVIAGLVAAAPLIAPVLRFLWGKVVELRVGWLRICVLCHNKTPSHLYITYNFNIKPCGWGARFLFWIYVRRNFSAHDRHIIYEQRG